MDVEAAKTAFEKVAKEVNENMHGELSLDEVVYGFIKVANETMCRPIRALTEARGKRVPVRLARILGCWTV